MTAPDPAPARSLTERITDTRRLLDTTVDAWVATADPTSGRPWLVPLSFAWSHDTLVLGTGADSRTVRNVLAQPWVRVSLGAVRDVVLVHGTAEVVALADLPTAEADLFAARSGFDPREEPRRTPTCGSPLAASRPGASRTSWPSARSCTTGAGARER